MVINNRRDAGYTIISRFEEAFRNFVLENTLLQYSNFQDGIPPGIFIKLNQKEIEDAFTDIHEFIINLDFPDLKDICLYKDNYKNYIGSKLDKVLFIEYMDSLYKLRCKIAHVKGYFNAIDLDSLIGKCEYISNVFFDDIFISLINKIKINPDEVIIKIPAYFIETNQIKTSIINNLPTPDYEFDGGFVGREEDQKKILTLLKSEKFPVITITGSGGVGKTALALKISQEIIATPDLKLFDAIIWLSAKENLLSPFGIEDIEPSLKNYDTLLETIISTFNFGIDQTKLITTLEKESFVNQIIELSEKILIIVDNLETITDQQIINFILEAPLKLKFLITSRKGIGQLERRYELKELKVKEAIYLFRQVSREKRLISLSELPDDLIKKYATKVLFYPLAIKWVIGQVARGKNINVVIDSIQNGESDITKFCYESIFQSLDDNCKRVLFALSCIEQLPTANILQYIVELDDQIFEDAIEELILISLVIPEQFQNDSNEISTKYILLPLTKGYTRFQLNMYPELKSYLINRTIQVENTVSESEKVKKEYKHSLYNFGAKTDEEKIATIIAQSAFQKYQTGAYESALEEYKRAIKIAPTFAPLYRNFAVMESYEGHIPEALILIEKASKLDQNDSQIFLLWGNIFRKSGRFLEAHNKYEIANSLSKNDPIILNALGQTTSKLGQFELAHSILIQANRNNSEFSSLKHEIINKTCIANNLVSWGDKLFRDKNYSEAEIKFNLAIANCMEAIDVNARDAKIYNALTNANLHKGKLLLYIGETTKALAVLNLVIDSTINYKNHDVYKLKALLCLSEHYVNNGFYIKARSYFDKIIKDFSESIILKSKHYTNLVDKYLDLKFLLDESKYSKGIITRVDLINEFVIITENKSKDTYICNHQDFTPKLTKLTADLVNKKVSFLPIVFNINNKLKKTAEAVRFDVLINYQN